MPIPISRSSASSSSVPLMMAEITSPGTSILLRPMVEETRILSTAPTQSRSSVFITMASWAIPFHTARSPVSFQYIYASDDFVPAPSACMMLQYSGSPPRMSGMILQKACGKIPLSMFLMALCTSSLAALTPRIIYLLSIFLLPFYFFTFLPSFYFSFPCQNSHEAKACRSSISSPLVTLAPRSAPFLIKSVWSGL